MADPSSPKSEPEIDWNRARVMLRARISSLLGRSDPATEDLTQEALVDLLRVVRREGWRGSDGLLTVIARSVVASEIRRRQRYRLRFADWEQHLDKIVELPSGAAHEWDDPLRTLWFLLVEYFRVRKAPCLLIAERYAELEDWKAVAEATGQTHDSVRQQWSRCSRMFREELRRNPGPYQEWLGGDG